MAMADYWQNRKWYIQKINTPESRGVRWALISILFDELPLEKEKYHMELEDADFYQRIEQRYKNKD